MSVLYRRMTLADVPQVHAIEERTFATPWSRQSFVDEMTTNKCARYLVAEEDGRVIAYAGAWMIFEEGQKHFSLYETPFGGLMLGVNTHRAKARIGEGGGSLSIRYALEADSQLIGENAFEIQVTEPTLDQRAPLDQAL